MMNFSKQIAMLCMAEEATSRLSAPLVAGGFQIEYFRDVHALVKALHVGDYEIVLVDQEVPDAERVFCVLRNERKPGVSIVFFNCVDDEMSLAAVLGRGADDYITRSRCSEIRFRIDALLRRKGHCQSPFHAVLEFPPYRFDVARKRAYIDDRMLDLTDKEFALGLFFFRNLGRILSRERLLDAVWGSRKLAVSRTVDTHVSRVRRKLDIHPGRGFQLSAVYGSGYRLESVDEESEPLSPGADRSYRGFFPSM